MTAHRARAKGALLLVALLALAAFAAQPAGAATKPYSLTIAPAMVKGGGTVSLTATFKNLTGTQQLGSANLTPPAGFTLQAPPAPVLSGAGSATIAGNVLQLRGLGLPPGGSVGVTFSVSVPCASGRSFTWMPQAKQSNDFNGQPGNDLTLSPPSPTTTVSGCVAAKLAFVQQPADARIGERITGAPFDPTDTQHLVSVEVEDASGARVVDSSAAITMTLGPSTGVGVLQPTTVPAVNGLATFSNLSISAAGSYTLSASSDGLQGATSNPFNIQQAAVQCIEDKTCSTGDVPKNHVSTNTTAAPVPGQPDAGFLTVSYDVGPTIECQGYNEFSPDQAEIQGPNRSKVVAFRVDKLLMNAQPNNGASFLDMCFGAPYSFATKPGTPAAVEIEPGFFVGRLPDCGAAPCVAGRNKNQSGDGIITVRVAAGPEDPAFRP